jgi:hypothetical protein
MDQFLHHAFLMEIQECRCEFYRNFAVEFHHRLVFRIQVVVCFWDFMATVGADYIFICQQKSITACANLWKEEIYKRIKHLNGVYFINVLKILFLFKKT